MELALWDTAGQEDYDRLRPLSYPDSDVVLICYSVDDPDSLTNVAEKWWPEVRHFCPYVPIVVVGNKVDLRPDDAIISELDVSKLKFVQNCQGREVATRIGAVAYHECSAWNNDGVQEVFEAATRAALRRSTCKRRRRHRTCKLL